MVQQGEKKTHRVAQNSNVPFPFPIRVSFPYQKVIISIRYVTLQESFTHLDTNRNIREDSQPGLRALQNLQLPLDHLFHRRQLLRTKAHSISFDPQAPFTEREGGTLGRAADGDGDDALVSFDVFDLPRCELRAVTGKEKVW